MIRVVTTCILAIEEEMFVGAARSGNLDGALSIAAQLIADKISDLGPVQVVIADYADKDENGDPTEHINDKD